MGNSIKKISGLGMFYNPPIHRLEKFMIPSTANIACDAFVESLLRLLSLRDIETEEHTRRVAALSLDLARAYGKFSHAELFDIYQGALIHDVGKIGIPDAVLQKRGSLTPEEEAQIRMHPIYAYELFRTLPCFESILDIAYCHHEKWDGSGYPRGLRGEQIPLMARLFTIADVWDALTSERHYRPPWPEEKVYDHILEQAGKHFDPAIVNLFISRYFRRSSPSKSAKRFIGYTTLQKKVNLFIGKGR